MKTNLRFKVLDPQSSACVTRVSTPVNTRLQSLNSTEAIEHRAPGQWPRRPPTHGHEPHFHHGGRAATARRRSMKWRRTGQPLISAVCECRQFCALSVRNSTDVTDRRDHARKATPDSNCRLRMFTQSELTGKSRGESRVVGGYERGARGRGVPLLTGGRVWGLRGKFLNFQVKNGGFYAFLRRLPLLITVQIAHRVCWMLPLQCFCDYNTSRRSTPSYQMLENTQVACTFQDSRVGV